MSRGRKQKERKFHDAINNEFSISCDKRPKSRSDKLRIIKHMSVDFREIEPIEIPFCSQTVACLSRGRPHTVGSNKRCKHIDMTWESSLVGKGETRTANDGFGLRLIFVDTKFHRRMSSFGYGSRNWSAISIKSKVPSTLITHHR